MNNPEAMGMCDVQRRTAQVDALAAAAGFAVQGLAHQICLTTLLGRGLYAAFVACCMHDASSVHVQAAWTSTGVKDFELGQAGGKKVWSPSTQAHSTTNPQQ